MYPDYRRMMIVVKQRQEHLLREAQNYRLLKQNNGSASGSHFMVSMGNLLIVLGTKLKDRYAALPVPTSKTMLQSEG
ncbi:MAG: hypothetical protein ABI947_00405 [Chloroflexota bacterium]